MRPRHGTPARIPGLVALFLAILAYVVPAHVAERTSEYQLKAAFIYNFANFTTWPDSTFEGEHSPLVVAILGDDPFGSDLDVAESKVTTSGRVLEVERVNSLAALPSCHILYISRSFSHSMSSIADFAKDRAILTITDVVDACDNGIMICFFSEDNKIRFHVNLDAVEDSKLRVDPRVLKLGRAVTGGKR
ncbi:MAG: YfiR family protein [Calditrichaeota bacterium]|nr:YfiR family protein [Calditrichota bacterium]MCB9391908.1 YfiR family protein [Calditrichota bacterium]